MNMTVRCRNWPHKVYIAVLSWTLFEKVKRNEFDPVLSNRLRTMFGPECLFCILNLLWKIMQNKVQRRIALRQLNRDISNPTTDITHDSACGEFIPWKIW